VASGEGRPISRFFDTLEYRERDPERESFPKYLRGGAGGDAGAETWEGEGPREGKAQESQGARSGETREASAPTGDGSKPLRSRSQVPARVREANGARGDRTERSRDRRRVKL